MNTTFIAGWHIMEIIFNGAASTLQIDGNAATTANPGTVNPAGLTIGTHGAESSGFAEIDIAEIIVCNPYESEGKYRNNK